MAEKTDVTQLLSKAQGGDENALNELLPLVYNELRRVAANQLKSERGDHTLQATALVHEAYLKLAGFRDVPWANRGHFYAAAAQAFRRVQPRRHPHRHRIV